MIPFFTIPEGYIGPIPIHPFGLLVATGIIVGHKLAMNRAKDLGLDEMKFEKLVFWTVATGIVLSHMLDTIFYHPEILRDQPWELFMIHHGLSSFGGFFGAGISFFVYSRRHKVGLWRSADAIAYGLPVGWMFGRMGCTVVHDHPGRHSTSWLAVDFPNRAPWFGPRYDLGLIELMLTPIVVIAAFVVAKRTKKPGAVIATITLLYPVIRFPLDFFRAGDPEGGDVRYFGLTPGHYACIVCFMIGLYIVKRTRDLPTEPTDAKQKAAKVGKKGCDASAERA